MKVFFPRSRRRTPTHHKRPTPIPHSSPHRTHQTSRPLVMVGRARFIFAPWSDQHPTSSGHLPLPAHSIPKNSMLLSPLFMLRARDQIVLRFESGRLFSQAGIEDVTVFDGHFAVFGAMGVALRISRPSAGPGAPDGDRGDRCLLVTGSCPCVFVVAGGPAATPSCPCPRALGRCRRSFRRPPSGASTIPTASRSARASARPRSNPDPVHSSDPTPLIPVVLGPAHRGRLPY